MTILHQLLVILVMGNVLGKIRHCFGSRPIQPAPLYFSCAFKNRHTLLEKKDKKKERHRPSSLIRACTTAIITLSVYCIFCKNVPGKLGDGRGRRLTRRRLRLVLPSSRDGRCSVVRASSLGYTRSGSSCGRAWWLRAPELSPMLVGDGAMCSPATAP